jgi:HAD superfamily hydrolase (TIGR01509 family)
MKYTVCIFDLNGVFIRSPPLSERFEKRFHVAKEEFLSALTQIMDIVRRPDAPELYSLWEPYFEKWNVELDQSQFYAFWFHAEKPNEEMITLAADLIRNGVRLYALSNNFRERATYYKKHFSFLRDIFEKVYYSWQTGFVKPDKKCWQLVLEENHIDPKSAIYFDDSDKNIAVAKSCGIDSVKFEDAAQVRELVLK